MHPESFYEAIESEPDSDDPSFDVLEKTRNLSIKKKSSVRDQVDEDVDCIETYYVAELDASNQKSFEIVQKISECGQVEKLKVKQCKLYLRKHGLRLTGKKDVLINRIKEHLSMMNGEREHKYPASSFVMNCKGDACTGDVVMFEQNVYEMFSIASRSATGPPCGKRVIAGRIVKESYGAAKQQHTFTIEVLWSKGVKPLPPLHPLLIKGRNLYRLKTMRQRWEDESERQRILFEKHARGNAARTDREARLKEKEKRKAPREIRELKKGNVQNEKQEKLRKTSPTRARIDSRNTNTLIQREGAPFIGVSGSHPLTSSIHNYNGDSYKANITPKIFSGQVNVEREVKVEQAASFRKIFEDKENMGCYPSRQNERRDYDGRANIQHPQIPPQRYSSQQGNKYGHDSRIYYPQSPPQKYSSQQGYKNGHHYDRRSSSHRPQNPQQRHSFQQGYRYSCLPRNHYEGQRPQICRYYAQGRCHYGTNCRYLH